MKTIVLDDDPTGTQCATNVEVLLDWDIDELVKVLRTSDSVYLQTNSRSLNEEAALEMAQAIKAEGLQAGKILGEDINFVLRGDSTLRGHVFSETSIFAQAEIPILFLPAYPEVGRTTLEGIHYVNIEGKLIRADETEFSKDPVFGFSTSKLVDYVAEKSSRTGFHVPLSIVRGDIENLVKTFCEVPRDSVILPDAVEDSDIERVAQAIEILQRRGFPIVVRCAAPLAALLAGVKSTGMIEGPLVNGPARALIIAGSHTDGASKQLAELAHEWGGAIVIETTKALKDPREAAHALVQQLRSRVDDETVVTISSERIRKADHGTLEHGDKVMKSLIEVVREIYQDFNVIIAKGGITSAEVARDGVGAKKGWVLGQILPGISVWKILDADGRSFLYVVVPGNVGNADTLLNVLRIIGIY